MSKRASPTVIGAFVIVAAGLVVAGALVLGGLPLFQEEMTSVAFFDGDVRGLAVGSPVFFRGALLGEVKAVKIALDPQNKIAVYLKIKVGGPEAPPRIRTQEDLRPFIERGLRAQLKLVSIITGQLAVSLDYLPNTPVMLTGLEPGIPELPTVPTQLAQYQAALDRILETLERTDVPQLVQDVGDMVRSVRDLARSPELTATLRSAGDALRSANATLKTMDSQLTAVGGRASSTLDATRQLVTKIDLAVEPLAGSLQSTLNATRTTAESAQVALATVNRTLDGETPLGDDVSQALRQLTGATRSLATLADYLERHPEALLRGKPGSEAER